LGYLPVKLSVRVKPGAKRAAVGGRWAGPNGDALIVAVAPQAVEGKANRAVLAAVAAAFGVRVRDVRLLAGEKSRDKLLEIDSAAISPADAAAILAGLLGPAATVSP
jgi:uncharacterized protein YggU (UPF0235/DUF167 family)